MSSGRPNIIFIMADDHAAHAMSCYGSYRNSTPNLDRIADEGMRLDNCFCTNSICTPSRAAILTGKYPHMNGVITFNALSANQVTFPQLLRTSGYYTAMVGKWHLDCEPTGFDHWNVVPGQGKYHDPDFIDNGVERTIDGYVTDIITDLTLDVLQERPKDRPFCILSQHKAPHDMWESDDKHAAMFADLDIPEPETLFDDYASRATAVQQSTQRIGAARPGHTLFEAETGQITDPTARKRAQYQEYMKRYLRCVASIDDNVGRILDYLDDNDLTENTIIIYTSDQGFFLGEHGWYDKRFMYEESLRMPFVVRYPDEIPAGTVDDHIILNTDFAATLLDYAGLKPAASMQSESFRPILNGEDPGDWRTIMYYRYYRSHFNTPSHWGVRTKQYKYIYYNMSMEHELYDLSEDASEVTNVYRDPKYGEVARHLRSEVSRLQKELGDTDDSFQGEIRALELLRQPHHPIFRL
jgi:arylsulfatase A-like enzyme